MRAVLEPVDDGRGVVGGVAYQCGAWVTYTYTLSLYNIWAGWGWLCFRVRGRLTRAALQASMFNADGGCQNYVSDQDDARSLARSDPDQAVMNANSRQYFTEDDQ